MSQEKKWVFFPYTAPDYKAAEDWLNERCQEGWRPEKFGTFFQRIKLLRQDGPPVCCCTDLYDTSSSPNRDYLALCQQAGWTRVGDINGIHLFVSQPGEKPAPIQTDQDMELERFKKFYLTRSLWGFALSLVILAALLGFFLWMGVFRPYGTATWTLAPLRSWLSFLSLPAILFFLLLFAWQSIQNLQLWQWARHASETGEAIPQRGHRQILFWGWVELLMRYCIPIYCTISMLCNLVPLYRDTQPITVEQAHTFPVVMAQDVGLDAVYLFEAEQTATPLARYHSSWELVRFYRPDGEHDSLNLKTTRYTCATEGLARWVALQLQTSVQPEHFFHPFLPGAVGFDPTFSSTYTPVSLGFDESWLFVDEPNEYSPHPSSTLALRQGKTAVLLQGPVDWTDPDILPILWERLALSPY